MTETASDDGAERPPYRLRLKELPADERPRERLKLRGAKSLSDSDLIAILLNTGTVGLSVTDLAQRLVVEQGGLRGLMRLEVAELARVRGVGDAKAVRLKAALELGRRLAAQMPEARPHIASPDDIVTLVQIEMAALDQEDRDYGSGARPIRYPDSDVVSITPASDQTQNWGDPEGGGAYDQSSR